MVEAAGYKVRGYKWAVWEKPASGWIDCSHWFWVETASIKHDQEELIQHFNYQTLECIDYFYLFFVFIAEDQNHSFEHINFFSHSTDISF